MNSAYGLGKGLLLVGVPGTGKTTLMRIFQKVLGTIGSPLAFQMLPTWKIAPQPSSDRQGILDIFDRFKGKDYCFDELGLRDRERIQYYGNSYDLGEEIILKRYNEYIEQQVLTHFTTNLSLEELQQEYGERAYDRLREMCNIIVIEGENFRLTSCKPPRELINDNDGPDEKELQVKNEKSEETFKKSYQEQCEAIKAAGGWVSWGFEDGLCLIYFSRFRERLTIELMWDIFKQEAEKVFQQKLSESKQANPYFRKKNLALDHFFDHYRSYQMGNLPFGELNQALLKNPYWEDIRNQAQKACVKMVIMKDYLDNN
ncbi:MAG: hypothetical protein AAF734_06015 [Bacteroidota bacterium]